MATRAERRELQHQQRAAKIKSQMTDTATTFILVRHGETTWNAESRIQGQTDEVPLNAVGLRQATALAEALVQVPLDAMYTSDLLRAKQTAQAISQKVGKAALPDSRLRERHMGSLQGLTRAEAALREPLALDALQSTDLELPIPSGGESISDMSRRITSCLEEIAGSHPGETVLLVTHGGVLNVCYTRAAGRQYKGRNVNGAINRIQVEGKKWLLLEWGRTQHLEGIGFLTAGIDADTGGS